MADIPETGPFLSMIKTPKGYVVRAVWLKHKEVTRTKDLTTPTSVLEAEDELKKAVVELILYPSDLP